MIAVVDYHKGNLKSVERGLVGVGADARITDDPATIARAEAIVLPGVGAFADA
ncbi:MAG TPA: imidazole glycerol phosphate synthase subunit HisH, partial [Eggerthellaceae bacterium]|nr:imidazole glycerol phosphate synthase subunit HisH [Eggerthellaceae bacterium]